MLPTIDGLEAQWREGRLMRETSAMQVSKSETFKALAVTLTCCDGTLGSHLGSCGQSMGTILLMTYALMLLNRFSKAKTTEDIKDPRLEFLFPRLILILARHSNSC